MNARIICIYSPSEGGHAARAAELAVPGVQLDVAVPAALVLEDAVTVLAPVRYLVLVHLRRNTK